MNEIKRCPFCGEKAVVKAEMDFRHEYYFWVVCTFGPCQARRLFEHKTKAAAIDYWNERESEGEEE